MTDTQTIDDGTNANVVVSVDAMGGDKGPGAIVAGLLRAEIGRASCRERV